MHGMENNILSVAVLLSVNKKNAISDVWLTYSWLDKTTSYSTRYGTSIKIWYQKNIELIYHKR